MVTSLPALTAVLPRGPAPEPGLPPACCGQPPAAATTRSRTAPGASPGSWCRSVAERCRSAAVTRHSRPGSRPAGEPPGRGPSPPDVLALSSIEVPPSAAGVRDEPVAGDDPLAPHAHEQPLHRDVAAERPGDRLGQARVGHPEEDPPDAPRVLGLEQGVELAPELVHPRLRAPWGGGHRLTSSRLPSLGSHRGGPALPSTASSVSAWSTSASTAATTSRSGGRPARTHASCRSSARRTSRRSASMICSLLLTARCPPSRHHRMGRGRPPEPAWCRSRAGGSCLPRQPAPCPWCRPGNRAVTLSDRCCRACRRRAALMRRARCKSETVPALEAD